MIPTRPLRVAVIGAGPIGLEAALRLSTSGFETVIPTSGAPWRPTCGDGGTWNWFSPFVMNSSQAGRTTVGTGRPGDDALLSGDEFAADYLEPLARAMWWRGGNSRALTGGGDQP